MRIVLHHQVSGLGNRGDLVDVSDGYARNFLIPKGLARQASTGVEAEAQAMKKAWTARDARDREAAEDIAKSLVSKGITISMRAGGEGKLFGSVTTADIAEAIHAQAGIELDRKMIDLAEGIRSVGSHSVTVHLHHDVQFPVNIEVVPL